VRTGAPDPEGRPFVAVVIPVFDDVERLAACLAALQRQTYPGERYEVVVVDNGSRQDVAGACRAFTMVRCISEPRPGSYAARNTGIARSDADILAFTDSDCLPHRDWLENAVTRLTATRACDILGGNVVVFSKDSSNPTAAELYEAAFAFPQRQRIEASHWSVTANLFVRRSVIEAVGPFDADLRSGGDAEWCQRAHAAGHCIEYAEDVRVDHPARSSLKELLTKARRVAGGARAARHDVPIRVLVRFVARTMVRTFRKTLRVLAGNQLDAGEARRFSVPERVRIAAVLHLVTARRLLEVVSLRLTKRTATRS